MGITLIVTKSRDENRNETGEEIPLDVWLKLVDGDATLRFRDPLTLTDPTTKQTISIDWPPGQADLCVDNKWVPFLGFHMGKLDMAFEPSLENKKNPIRRKVAEVARQLGAIITHSASDEILRW